VRNGDAMSGTQVAKRPIVPRYVCSRHTVVI
jgi:hypothetical protein